jgi:protein-S-isoprenylcysteine O-methyltransferase Ste14
MFAALTWWFARRGSTQTVVLLAVLLLVELVFLPGYERTKALDWIMQGATLVPSTLGLVAALGTVVTMRRERRGTRVEDPSVT